MQRTVWLALLCLSIALSLDQGPVYKAVDGAVGIPNLDNLIAYALGLTASFYGQAFLWHSAEPGAAALVRVRRRKVCLCLVLGIMGLAFALGPIRQRDDPNFGSTQAIGTAADVYWLAFLSYALFALYELVGLCLRFGRLAQGRSLGLGLRLVAAGGALAAVHFGYQYGIYLLIPSGASTHLARLGHSISDVLNTAALIGTGLLFVGAVLPAWTSLAHRWAPMRKVGLWRSHQRLRPLWEELYQVTPEIALGPPMGRLRERIDIRDLDFRIDRRLVEIRDGLLGLRPYADVADRARAREAAREYGLSGTDLDDAVEAACLASALRGRKAGRPAVDVEFGFGATGGAGLEEELNHLALLAMTYRRSPVARQMR